MAEPGETLIPDDTVEDARVDAALGSALALDAQPEDDGDDAIPFGMSWAYDWDAGHFVRSGSGAVPVYGEDALAEWCQMAIAATRSAHAVFTEAFGIESLDAIIGHVMADEIPAEFEARLRDALLVHERIVDIQDISIDYDVGSDVLSFDAFSVITDEEESVELTDSNLNLGA